MELIGLVNSVIIFLSQTIILRWLIFLLGSQTLILSPALLDLFISSDASICSEMAFPPLVNSDPVVVSVSIDFPSNSQWGATFHEFCEWVQVGIDVHIPHQKYQVKPHLSPWFSAASAAAIVHRNHFFHLYQQNKSSESKVKFRQASNHSKRVIEAAKIKQESIASQKLGSRDFWQIANSALSKGKYYTSSIQ